MNNWKAELNQKDLKKLFDKMKEVDKVCTSKMKSAFMVEGHKINAEQKRYAPYDKGNLRSNIVFNILQGGKEVELQSNAEYSKQVEFGNANPRDASKRIPFFYPPIEAGRKRLVKKIEKLIDEATK
jgi:HK97 gp10 family phage protein